MAPWPQPRDRKSVGFDIKTAQYGWPVGMPLIRKLEPGLWEVRTRLEDGNARVLFTVDGDTMVLLHSFVKKSQKTPATDLKTAQAATRRPEEEVSAVETSISAAASTTSSMKRVCSKRLRRSRRSASSPSRSRRRWSDPPHEVGARPQDEDESASGRAPTRSHEPVGDALDARAGSVCCRKEAQDRVVSIGWQP